jgi:prepilin-type N-terminal cleavage/methylation domain-containing protein
MTRWARGFTLIEVVIATSLLTVIAIGSAQLFALAIRQSLAAREQLFITSAAARRLDELIAAARAGTLAASPPDALDRNSDGFFDLPVESGTPCVRRWSIWFPPEYAGGAAAIAVRVSRLAGGATTQIATLAEARPR